MILVDSSIWIDHLRRRDAILSKILDDDRVLTHPFVIGELAMGSLAKRDAMLFALQRLPKAAIAQDSEVLTFVEQNSLFGRGIGYIDAHLLASTRITAGASLWTRDLRLRDRASALSISFVPES